MERNPIDNDTGEKEISAQVDNNENVIREREDEESATMDFESDLNESAAVVVDNRSSSQCNLKRSADEPKENESNEPSSENPIASSAQSSPDPKRFRTATYGEADIDPDNDPDGNSVTNSSVDSDSDDGGFSNICCISTEEVVDAFSSKADTAFFFKKMAAIASNNARRTDSAVKPFVESLRTVAAVARTNGALLGMTHGTAIANAYTAAADSYVSVLDAMISAAESLSLPSLFLAFPHSR